MKLIPRYLVLVVLLLSCTNSSRYELNGYYTLSKKTWKDMIPFPIQPLLKFTNNNLDSVYLTFGGNFNDFKPVKFSYSYKDNLLLIRLDTSSVSKNDMNYLFGNNLMNDEIVKNIDLECAVLSPRRLSAYLLYGDTGKHLPELEYRKNRPVQSH